MIPLILGALPSLIQLAESLISKTKSGSDKKDLVLQQVRMLIEKAIATGVVPEAKISDDTLAGMIETVLAQLKATGTVTPAAVVTIPANGWWLIESQNAPVKIR